jgi:hypothetical protein
MQSFSVYLLIYIIGFEINVPLLMALLNIGMVLAFIVLIIDDRDVS